MATTEVTFTKIADNVLELVLPLEPVPAARPKVSKWGTYYPKRYRTWKAEAARLLQPYWHSEPAFGGAVYAMVQSVVTRPKKPSNPWPHPDVDNYAKAALDAVTGMGAVWGDDKQVVLLTSSKRFTSGNELAHTWMRFSDDPEHLLFGRNVDGENFAEGQDFYDLPMADRLTLEELDDGLQ